jgi:hypothetical protein
MPFTDWQSEVLRSILDEWNRAERDIKISEQVSNNIVIPSIKELRYAGRRIVEALNLMLRDESEAEVRALLADAAFDCHRARHDAIDSATAKIAVDLEIMTKKLGYEVILPVYPTFPKLVQGLIAIRRQITLSREKRQQRDAIYSVLQAADFPQLVSMFDDMRSSEHIMKTMARRRRRSEAIGVIGAVLGLVGIVLAIYFWRHP